MRPLYFLGLFLLLLPFTALAQQQIPERIQVKFRAKFPEATQEKWMPEGKNYQVDFTEKGLPSRARFSSNGQWLQTQTTLKQNQWPKLSRKYTDDNHSDSRYLEGYRYDSPQGSHYQMIVENKSGRYKLDFDGEGGFVNEEPAN